MNKIMEYLNIKLHSFLGANYSEFISTIILIAVVSVSYSIIFYWIKNRNWSNDKKRRNATNVRNTFVLIALLGLIFIWSGEIKTMILSITALCAAILIAFKEMILCFLGSFLIASNKLFALGDYIEVDGIKGKVIDKNLVYTKIIIYEPFNTREMSIPNITFVINKMINLSHYGKFHSYNLKLSLPSFTDVKVLSVEVDTLIKNALINHAKKYNDYFNGKKMNDIYFDVPKNYYQLEYDLSDNKNWFIKLSYLAHPLDQKEIEQTILTGYVNKVSELQIGAKDGN